MPVYTIALKFAFTMEDRVFFHQKPLTR